MQAAPINAGEYTPSHLELFARQLAEQHPIAKSREQNSLLSIALLRWSNSLHEAYQFFRTSASKELTVFRAGEWMLDNYYIIEQTLREIEKDLPPSYYQQLPKLDGTSLKHYPRIFALASELVAYSQCQIDLPQLAAFVLSYQQTAVLTTGELWALPIMLRIALLENLSAAVAAVTGINAPTKLNIDSLPPASPDMTDDAVVANCFISLREIPVEHFLMQFFTHS